MNAACLVLCDSRDRSAARVYCALRDRLGARAVEVVVSEQLMLAPHWRHALEAGRAVSAVTLGNGRRIDPESFGLVFQRIRHVEVAHFARAKPEDREYALAEMHALLLSWLAGLPCPVVNRAGPRGLCGAERSRLEWLALAAKAGFPIRKSELVSDARRSARHDLVPFLACENLGPEDPSRVRRPELLGRGPVQWLERLDGPQRQVLVAGSRCWGLPPGVESDVCARLARLSGEQLLEIHLGTVRGEWRFCGASPVPELSPEAARFVADILADMRGAA